jgi:hypothetical protein
MPNNPSRAINKPTTADSCSQLMRHRTPDDSFEKESIDVYRIQLRSRPCRRRWHGRRRLIQSTLFRPIACISCWTMAGELFAEVA